MKGVKNRMQINKILLKDLPIELVCYLQELDLTTDPAKKAAIPVYYKKGGENFFISDYVLRDNRAFEKSAPSRLYRGGALLKVITKQGCIVIYDERYKWLRMVGGIARHSEGLDLMKTAVREGVVEELSVLANGEKTRLVPIGMSGSVGLTIDGWGITAENIEETGALSVVKTIFNEANHAFEIVVQWDLSDCDGLIVLHSEDWYKGGRTGFAPLVIDDIGDVIGFYDGRHGYVPLPVQNLHPTLASVL